MARPVRASQNMLVNSPGGWVSGQPGPVPWGSPPGGAFWWVGSTGPNGPIGPNGPHMTSGEALAVVTRAVSLILDPLTTGEMRVRRGSELEPGPRWLTDPHLLRPDGRVGLGGSGVPVSQRRPQSLFWRGVLRSALLHGRGFVVFVPDEEKAPMAGTLQEVDPAAVSVNDDGSWRLGSGYDWVDTDTDGNLTYRGQERRLVQVENPHTPLGVLGQHPDVFRLGAKISGYTSSTFTSGVPAGFLKVTGPNLTQEQADELKASWMRAHGTSSRSTAVLNAVTDYQPIQLSPVDSAVVEVSRTFVADVAYAFGEAPEVLGVSLGGSMTYSNQRDWFTAHRDFTLSPWIAALSGALSALLPAGTTVDVNLDAYLQTTEAEAIAVGAQGTAAGLTTRDEWRAKNGYPPWPEPAPASPAMEEAPDADA
jgi:HK97 family phage portal protein